MKTASKDFGASAIASAANPRREYVGSSHVAGNIKLWFDRAVPKPTDKSRAVQFGCHVEEYAEMLHPLGFPNVVEQAFATHLKTQASIALADVPDRAELLDSLCDQIVTAIGMAHMFGMNIVGALGEVNRSNWSKFVDGQPVFDENGKIAKGPNYSKPDLTPYV